MTSIEMPYRSMGDSGLKLSALSLGGWTTFGGSLKDEKLTTRILAEALDSGINFFDMADIYAKGGAEELMGKALRHVPRHELVLSSKVFFPMSDDINDRGLSRKHIVESVEKSLKRLGTDYLDIYFCHRYDPETPVRETVLAMNDLIRQGKILYWGTSEWSGDQMTEARYEADHYKVIPPSVEQPQYNLYSRARVEGEILEAASELGTGLVTWSPLSSGLLTGKYNAGVPADSRLSKIEWLGEQYLVEAKIEQSRQFCALARKLGHSPSQLAIAWCLRQRGISSVITGATKLQQLKDNLGALSIELDLDCYLKLDQIFCQEVQN